MESTPNHMYDVSEILYQNFDGLVYVLNDHFECEFINQEIHLKELGYSSLSKNLIDYIYFEECNSFLEFLDNVLKNGNAIEQVRIQSKYGYQFYELKGTRFKSNTEELKILLLAYDISDYKQNEKMWEFQLEQYKEIAKKLPEIRYWNLLRSKDSKIEFHETREMLDLVIDNIPQLIYWKDLNLRYLGCNINYARINGINDVRFLTGKSDHELIWPKDNITNIIESEKRVIKNNNSENSIESWIAPDKSKLYYQVNRIPLHDFDGNVIGVLSSYNDISERLEAEHSIFESEKKYRSILENIAEGYYEVDSKGNYTFSNDAFCEITGYSREELIKKNYTDLTYGDIRNRIYEIYNKVFKTGIGIQQIDLEFLNKSGNTVYVETSIYLRYDSEGNKIGFFGIIKDITEEYLLRQKLISSEKKYRHLFDKSPFAIWIVDLKGNIIDVNSTTDKLLSKFKSEDLIGENFEDILAKFGKSEYYLPFFREKFRNFIEGIEKKPLDFQITRADGKQLWLTLQSSKFTLENETLIQVLIGDNTEKKLTHIKLKNSEEALKILNKELEQRVEERTKELQESEGKFRTIAEQSTLGIVILQDGVIKFANNAVETITGYSREESGNWPKNSFTQNIYPDDLEMVLRMLKRIMSGEIETKAQYTFRVNTKSNQIKWIELHSRKIQYNKKDAILNCFIDITEKKEAEEKLKESEAKFRNLYENSPYGIVIFNKSGIIVDLNSMILKLFGYKKEELLGKNYVNLIGIYPGETQPAIKDIQYFMKKGIDSDSSFDTRITKIYKKDKSYAWVQSKISEIMIGGERFVQAMIQDFTEKVIAEEKLKESEKKLREQNIELKKLDKLKTDFITIAAHELKTPLISIGGYIDLILMRENEIKPPIREDLNRVLKNVYRLEDYVNKLLDVMKIDTQKMELDKKSENIYALIKECVNALDFQIQRKSIKLQIQIEKTLRLKVDPFRMSQVFTNLITNAIYASSEGNIISIEASRTSDSTIFKIIDQGKGLTEEQIKRLFGKFVVLNQDLDTFSTFEKGSGLGLYIAKGIIEAHGGKIWVESQGLEKGATFYINIPN